jgi:hypothetical protein
VDELHPSIRWGYEKADTDSLPNEQGTFCYWCDRGWVEHSSDLPEAPMLSKSLRKMVVRLRVCSKVSGTTSRRWFLIWIRLIWLVAGSIWGHWHRVLCVRTSRCLCRVTATP